MRGQLEALHGAIEARVRETLATRPDWPCRKGCDTCCRRLAEPPRLTPPEREWPAEGIVRLPSALRDTIAARARAMSTRGPLVCPLPDRAAGACLVYESRPAACRTYGFYVERGLGLYCRQIEELEASPRLAACGPSVGLREVLENLP